MHEESHSVLARLAHAAHRLETPCGDGTMAWHVWGQGPALVLLHGGAGSWRHWVRNIGFFARRYTVLAPDLPGLGESAMPPAPIGPESIAAIIAGGIDHVLGAGVCYDLVGFSFGGAIASFVALQHSTQIRSLTIVSTGSLGLPRNPIELVKVRHLQGIKRRTAHTINLARMMFANPAAIDDLAIAIQDINTQQARLNTSELSRRNPLRHTIGKLPMRLGAIYGTRDAAFRPRIAEWEAMYRALQPSADFRSLPQAGHWLMYEMAEQFNLMLEERLSNGIATPAARDLSAG